MMSFKEKGKDKNKKNTTQISIDGKHNEIMKQFENEKNSLHKLKNKMNQLNNELEKLKKIPNSEISDEDIHKRFEITDKLEEITKKIKIIESNDDINKYYLNTAHILFHYYNKSNNTSQPKVKGLTNNNDIKQDPLSKSILHYFKNNSNEGEPEQIPTMNINNNKTQLLDKFLSYVDSKSITDKNKDEDIEICLDCNIQKLIISSEGLMICPNCRVQEYILIDCDKPSYKEPPKEISYFAYKKINHFNCWSGTVGIHTLMMWCMNYIWNIICFYNQKTIITC